MDPIQMSSFRQECEGLLEKEAAMPLTLVKATAKAPQSVAAKWKALESGSKWYDPRRWAKGFGLGVERAGQMVQHPIKTTREGWRSMGRDAAGNPLKGGGWMGQGKYTSKLPVGMKSLTVGFTAPGVYSGMKKTDPYGENRSRTERVMGAIGGGLGWAAMPYGAIPAITTSMLAEKAMSSVGKGVHGAGQVASRMSDRRRAAAAQAEQARG